MAHPKERHVIGDDPHESIAMWLAYMYGSAVVAYPVAKVWDKVDTFFHRPYNWSTFKYTNSPFDDFKFRMRYGPVHKAELLALRTKMNILHYGPKASKVLGWAGYAYSAYEVGSAYHEGGKQGLFDYGLETVEENYRFVFPFLNTFFPE